MLRWFAFRRDPCRYTSYRCKTCERLFEKLLFSSDSPDAARTPCPDCGAEAPRDYSTHTFASPNIGTTGELAEDSEPYKAMHYHEKRGEWEQAAKAAEGVSDFAKQKFIQKAEQD